MGVAAIKEYRFPVSLEWPGGKRVHAQIASPRIGLDVVVGTEEGREAEVRAAAERAERGCLVSTALAIPCHINLAVRRVTASSTT